MSLPWHYSIGMLTLMVPGQGMKTGDENYSAFQGSIQ